MFHASHCEYWRSQDAGMTSGVMVIPLVWGLWDRLRPIGIGVFPMILCGEPFKNYCNLLCNLLFVIHRIGFAAITYLWFCTIWIQ